MPRQILWGVCALTHLGGVSMTSGDSAEPTTHSAQVATARKKTSRAGRPAHGRHHRRTHAKHHRHRHHRSTAPLTHPSTVVNAAGLPGAPAPPAIPAGMKATLVAE
ncbi:MAG TPA: hypothetical protein VHT27_09395 [Solirubrobacteraceae bacterium]|nr:hypothetical protein [Solirubrobacteraceae bacterium]